MAETIIGLDLGYSGVKAVLLARRLVGFEWIKSVKMDWPEEVKATDWVDWLDGSVGPGNEANPSQEVPEFVVRTVTEVWTELSAGRGQVVVSVPASLCSIRTLSLPFSDERRLSQVVPYEVESQLPYPLDEVVIDYQILHMKEGRSRLLIAAVRKAYASPARL